MRILIVEDEPRIAEAIRKGLTQEKFIVDTANDGVVGYDLASDGNYDLLIIDIMLPKMSGVEICSKLRSKEISTPILLLTAKGEITDKVDGLNSGADDYLTKPFAFEELVARVRALTRRPHAINQNIIKVRDLLINTSTYNVERSGTNIKLTSKEYSLLEYLTTQSPNIVSKSRIMEKVWNYESDVLPNTVEVYIKNLRQKIDMPFKDMQPLIKTIRGFGYKIA